MKNFFYTKNVIMHRNLYCITCIFILFISGVYAQVGTPSYFNTNAIGSSNAFPLNTTATNKVQWIYAPNSFSTLGDGSGTPTPSGYNITKVYIKFSPTVFEFSTYSNFTISLGQNVGNVSNYPLTPTSNVPFNTGLTQCFQQVSGFTFAGIL